MPGIASCLTEQLQLLYLFLSRSCLSRRCVQPEQTAADVLRSRSRSCFFSAAAPAAYNAGRPYFQQSGCEPQQSKGIRPNQASSAHAKPEETVDLDTSLNILRSSGWRLRRCARWRLHQHHSQVVRSRMSEPLRQVQQEWMDLSAAHEDDAQPRITDAGFCSIKLEHNKLVGLSAWSAIAVLIRICSSS